MNLNVFTLSGLLKGEPKPLTDTHDGVMFTVVTRDTSKKSGPALNEFVCVAYNDVAQFLKSQVQSGGRVAVQGRLSSEKLDTPYYHTAVSVSKVLTVGDANSGYDYNHVVLLADADAPQLAYLPTGVALVNITLMHEREYTKKDGSLQTYKTYLSGTLWAERAEEFSRLIPFNGKMLIRGIVKPRTYEKDGYSINRADIWVDDYQILETYSGTASVAPSDAKARTPADPSGSKAATTSKPLDSAVPF